MATPQQQIPAGAPQRPPTAAQAPAPHQNIILQHGHPQHQLVPMMPTVGHFQPQAANYSLQMPLQHQNRPPLINGTPIPPGTQPNFGLTQQQTPQNVAVRQAEHLRRLQQGGIANPAAPLGPTPFQPPMTHVPNPQQLQQLHSQQPQMRLVHQSTQMMPQQVIHIQHAGNPNVSIPFAYGPEGQLQALQIPMQRFAEFSCHLAGMHPAKQKLAYWAHFVREWFLSQGDPDPLKLVLGEGQQGRKEFELPFHLLHHFFHTIHHISGVRQMHIILGAQQGNPSSNVVECQAASILFRFESGTQVIWDGSVKAIFKRVPEGTLKIVRLEMSNDEFTEFIPRHVAQQILTPPLSNRSTSPDARRSPAERNQTLNRTKSDIGIGDERSLPLPKTTLNEMGVPTHLMRFLEVAEVCVCLGPLIDFSTKNECSPQQALQAYPQMQNGKPPQPNFTHPSQMSPIKNEMSPLVPHAAAPGMIGSPQPHYPSPMSSQTSQTGANGPNTTPLMQNRQAPSSAPTKVPQSNKRRRGSAVASAVMKEEEDEQLPTAAPAKHPKQSPRVGMTGRGGGPPGKRLRSDG